MSNTVEDQIVAMKFDNKQFESGVATSIGSIDKLNQSLQFKNAGQGISDLNRGVSGFNLNPMTGAIEGVNKMWLGMATVAVTAIANITNKVVDAGLKMAKSLVIDPFTQGFDEYSTNLNSIQTIIANTGAELPAVNHALAQLNTYADKTIYNFSQMAQNIGRFTAAGVKMGDAVDAIKGMANVAALSGATADQLNSAMYQMSQALSTGVIRLMDWNSLANANMGGQNIQKALQATAMAGKDAGAGMTEAIDKAGNFRDSLQAGWLTGDIFTKTMKVMAGQLNKSTGAYQAFSVEQLKGMGYSQDAAVELNRLSQASIDSATKVKTIGQAYDVIKESIGSGWAKVFQNIFGNFEKSKKLWTGVTTFITGGISGFFAKINKVLNNWNKLGGRFQVLQGLKQAFKDLLRIFVPIKNAFKEVFPPATGDLLVKLSHGFHDFFTLFRINVKTMHVIRDIFVGIFSVLKFGFGVIGTLFGLIKKLFVALASTGLPQLLGKIAKASIELGKNFAQMGLPKILKAFQQGAGVIISFVAALKPLVPVLENVGNALKDLALKGYGIAQGIIGGLLQGLDASAIQTAMVDLANNIVTWIKDALGIHSPATELVPVGENIILGIVQGLKDGLHFLLEAFKAVGSFLVAGFKQMVGNVDIGSVLNVAFAIGLFAFYRSVKKFFDSFGGLIDSAKGVFDEAGGIFGQITNNLKTMQNKVRSEIIRNIAISVGILAASAWLLSKVDGKKLGVSLAAIAGMMTTLIGAMKIVGGGAGEMDSKQVAKQTTMMLAISAAMVAFAGAILIMVAAVALMGQLDQKTIAKGLEGVTAVIGVLVGAAALLNKGGGAGAIFAAAAALLVMSFALLNMAGVLKLYSTLDWKTMVQGGGAAAAVIVALGWALKAFGTGAVGGSVALLVASGALIVLAGALKIMASIGLGDMVKVIVAIGALLTIVAAAALAMSVAEGGAASMLVMAGAIIVLAVALKILAAIPLVDLLKAFGALVLLFTIIGAAAIVLTPVVPLIAALGGAMLILGAAMLLMGVGMLAFASGLALLATAGTAGFAVLTAGILAITQLIPVIAKGIGEGIIAIAEVLSGAGPVFLKAFATALAALLDAFILVLPKVGKAISTLIHTVLDVLYSYISDFVKFGVNVIVALLDGIGNAIPRIAHSAANIIIAFMDAIATEYPRIIDAGFKMLIKFINGISNAIDDNVDDLRTAGLGLARAIINGMTGGLLDEGLTAVRNAAESIADALPGWMRKVLHINSPSKRMEDEVGREAAAGVASGLDKHAPYVQKSAEDLANKSLDAMRYAFKNSKALGNSLSGIQPKITPILDLSQLEREASKIGGKLGTHTIRTDTSRAQARDIAAEHASRQHHAAENQGGDEYNFNQTIISPEPVNPVKVYRGTHSQIALFKEVKGK